MKTKKLLCMLLAAVMLLSLCGMAALASGEDLVIANAEEWSAFCDALENGTDYEGCTVTLTTDIVTDKMAGSSVRSGANLTATPRPSKALLTAAAIRLPSLIQQRQREPTNLVSAFFPRLTAQLCKT